MTRTVVITGCSTGLGHAAAFHLARRGWRVLATVRKQADHDRLLAEAVDQGLAENLRPLLCDITQPASIEHLRQIVTEAGDRLDALVNNAGTGFPAPLELLALDDLRAQLEVNLIGHLAVTQALLPALKEARGTIVNISSISGRIAYPINGAYSMSKFALEAMSDVLRIELAPFGVKVVVMEPGSSPTPLWKTSLQRGRDSQAGRALDAYAPLAARVEAVGLKDAARGFAPQLFADVLLRILESRRPATRYRFPGVVGLLIDLRRLMPDRLWDFAVRRVLKW